MNAHWVSLGTQRWYQDSLLVPAPDGGGSVPVESAWYTGRNTPAQPDHGGSVARWRIGEPAALRSVAGKVVRGFSFAGRTWRRANRPANLYVLPEVLLDAPVVPIAAVGDPASAYHFSLSAGPSTKPIGQFYAAEHFAQFPTDEELANAHWWAGALTDWVSSPNPTPQNDRVIVYPTIDELRVLVSERPRYRLVGVTGTPSVGVYEQVTLKFRFEYPGPSDDPVRGLAVVLAGSGAVSLSAAGAGVWGVSATAVTDDAGYVSFDVYGESPGNTLLSLGLTGADQALQNAFEPALPALLLVRVTGSLPPPVPGECTTYPEVPEVPGTPASVHVSENYGWNSGANSADEYDGDVGLEFSGQPSAVGAVVGLTPTRSDVGSKDRMTHAFYFHQTGGGSPRYRVIENGVAVTAPQPYNVNDLFSIQRVNGRVSYRVGGTLIHQSRRTSEGPVSAGCAVYAAQDKVPSSEAPGGGCFWVDVAGASQSCDPPPEPGSGFRMFNFRESVGRVFHLPGAGAINVQWGAILTQAAAGENINGTTLAPTTGDAAPGIAVFGARNSVTGEYSVLTTTDGINLTQYDDVIPNTGDYYLLGEMVYHAARGKIYWVIDSSPGNTDVGFYIFEADPADPSVWTLAFTAPYIAGAPMPNSVDSYTYIHATGELLIRRSRTWEGDGLIHLTRLGATGGLEEVALDFGDREPPHEMTVGSSIGYVPGEGKYIIPLRNMGGTFTSSSLTGTFTRVSLKENSWLEVPGTPYAVTHSRSDHCDFDTKVVLVFSEDGETTAFEVATVYDWLDDSYDDGELYGANLEVCGAAQVGPDVWDVYVRVYGFCG